MPEFKYIMYEVKGNSITIHLPIIFPGNLVHADVDKFMRGCIVRTFEKATVKPITAGMINELQVASVYGESETLRLKSNKEDATTIEQYPYFNDIK